MQTVFNAERHVGMLVLQMSLVLTLSLRFVDFRLSTTSQPQHCFVIIRVLQPSTCFSNLLSEPSFKLSMSSQKMINAIEQSTMQLNVTNKQSFPSHPSRVLNKETTVHGKWSRNIVLVQSFTIKKFEPAEHFRQSQPIAFLQLHCAHVTNLRSCIKA